MILRWLPLALLAAAPGFVPAAAADPPAIAPPPRPIPPAFDLADWTPRPATGKAEPWEKMTDVDWVDARFRVMDTGPFLNATMKFTRGADTQLVYKATAIRLGEKNDAGVIFDRCTMRLMAAWTGGYLQHSDRRFGLLNTPTPKGDLVYANRADPGWAASDGNWDTAVKQFTRPLPADWASFRGLHLHGNRVVLGYTVDGTEVLETAGAESANGFTVLTRTIEVSKSTRELTAHLFQLPPRDYVGFPTPGKKATVWLARARAGRQFAFAVIGTDPRSGLQSDAGWQLAAFEPSDGPRRVKLLVASIPEGGHADFAKHVDASPAPEDLAALTRAGPKRWGEPLVTKLVRGDEAGPFAVDTLTVPYQNRFNALFFCTGVDFLPDGRIAVCTCHGDVWLVTVDETARTCSWQRFATGLYHPLGLKVVGGKVVVLERGQLTRLHDENNDGEADFYECLTNHWHTGAGEHSYDTCLETDPQGNFYFFKTGDTNLPHGGCLMKASKDGSKVEVFATGFRHPIGMGMSSAGVLTGADQEGNWMPATRVDEYKQGGFYGDMRANHRAVPPKTFDGPLCWIPREVDNSAGGQVWVPPNTFGPLAGLPLHFSYGRCRPFVLLRQECDSGVTQGGVAALDIKFLSGVCRGRFHPADGHLYVCGLNGWQTAAQADGCLQRVRYTGKPLDVPVKLAVAGDTIRLTFSRPLDPKAAANPENYKAAWWNYWWRGEYGSQRWKVSDPNYIGQDDVPVRSAELLPDGRTVVLRFEKLQPVMQMQVGYNVLAADGRAVVGSVFHTIHTTGK